MTAAHLTIENVERLAAQIAATYELLMEDARDLAEFNLRYASSYAEAAARILQ